MPLHLICVGHIAHDVIYRVGTIPSVPTKVLATGYSECGGGMAANASVAARRLGADVRLWGRVGDDPLGQRIVAELDAEGVDVSGVRRVAGRRSTSTAILVDDAGERLICSYSDPLLDRDPTWLPLADVRTADAVLVDVRWPEGSTCVLDSARGFAVPAVLDADVGAPEVLLELASRATHAIFSQPGLAVATGGGIDPGAALARIGRGTRALVGVTLGADGFLWLDQGREQRAPAPSITPVDTLAAGDVWHAAFAIALAESRSVAEAARIANVAAAIKCTRPGGRSGAPTRAEVESRLV
jgi:sulfofructose kinase